MEAKFNCELCDKLFSQQGSLNRHIKAVHDQIKDIRCIQCNFTCSQQSDLKTHIKQVHLRPAESKRMSLGEYRIQTVLKKFSIPFQREHRFNDLISNKKWQLRFDFALPINNSFILIEFDGQQHFQKVRWSNEDSEQQIHDRFVHIQTCDNLKNDYARKNGYQLLRVRYDDTDVQDTILNFLIEHYDIDVWKTYE